MPLGHTNEADDTDPEAPPAELEGEAGGRWRAWLEERGELPHAETRSPAQAWTTPVGALLLVAGTVLSVLPAPSTVFLIVGLALLGREYAWANRPLGALRRALPAGWRRRTERLLGEEARVAGS